MGPSIIAAAQLANAATNLAGPTQGGACFHAVNALCLAVLAAVLPTLLTWLLAALLLAALARLLGLLTGFLARFVLLLVAHMDAPRSWPREPTHRTPGRSPRKVAPDRPVRRNDQILLNRSAILVPPPIAERRSGTAESKGDPSVAPSDREIWAGRWSFRYALPSVATDKS